MRHLRRSDISLPPGKQKLGTHLSLDARRKAPPHNAIAARPLHAADAPSPEGRVLSDSPNPSGESLNSQVEFHALMEMMKSLQQQMVYARLDTIFIPSAVSVGIPSQLAATALTPDMASIAHHLQATSQLHSLSTLRASDLNNPLALHLQVQPILDGFQIPKMAIFGPTSDLTGHVVNYNIHMDFCITSEGLKCRAFPATLDEKGKNVIRLSRPWLHSQLQTTHRFV
ncbi:hypothetical protein ACLOJK_024707 [Asimina triloba]